MDSDLRPVENEELLGQGVLRLAIPNPFFEGRNQIYVLLNDPLTIVDTGIATGKAWQAIVDELHRHDIAPSDIRRVLLTHKHIDHIGNAWRFQQLGGATIHIHPEECHAIREVDPVGTRYAALVQDQFQRWQVPADKRSEVPLQSPWTWDLEAATPEAMDSETSLRQGDKPLEVLATPGHTRGSLSLRCGQLLFTGDHVLPTISPNVGGGDLRNRGLLTCFYQSLHRMLELPDELIVLPGHGQPFRGLHARARALLQHHDNRLSRILEILAEHGPCNVYALANALFGELKDFHIVLGCAEAEAHLEYLLEREQVVRDESGRFEAR